MLPPAATTPALKSGVLAQNFDPSVRVQDDFYRHVNGQWLTATQIPADRSSYGAFVLLHEGAQQNLRQILEAVSAQPNRVAGSDAPNLSRAEEGGGKTRSITSGARNHRVRHWARWSILPLCP